MELNCTDRGGNIKADFLFFFFLNQSIDRYRGGDIQSRRRHLFRFHSKNSQNQIFCHVFFFSLWLWVSIHEMLRSPAVRAQNKRISRWPMRAGEASGELVVVVVVVMVGRDRRSGPVFSLSYTTWDSTHCLGGGQTWGWTPCVLLKYSALLDFFFFFEQFLENCAQRCNLTVQTMKCYEDLNAQDLQEPSKCLLIKHPTVPTPQHP